jgi:hypothetical protein
LLCKNSKLKFVGKDARKTQNKEVGNYAYQQ